MRTDALLLAAMLTLFGMPVFAATETSPANRVQTVPIEPPDGDETGNATQGLNDLVGDNVPAVSKDISALPDLVQRTRQAIMDAARTGDIGNMLPVIEQNEFPPTMGQGDETDLIAFLKSLSGDEAGREILAILLELLDAGYAHVDPGGDREVYVWPYFTVMPFDRLTAEQEVDLFRIITPADKADMESHAGQYTFLRLGIGKDGTWYFLLSGD